ncbi:unnamed protein product [Cyclocybe aegerita]|uniref:Uncharacterized protein n=1 Tax=Cyclocybe aegerita TaxID=1973307 RepID=A0A8S0WEU7_CYCAE|nr:unnamed protein product [Cyclocybe aegerita]
MSTPQDTAIKITTRLDLKGALALLRSPHYAFVTSLTLSNLRWDAFSPFNSRGPVPEHWTPCARPLEVTNIPTKDLIQLKNLNHLILVGDDPFILLPFIQQPPFLVSLTIIRTDQGQRWWTDDYEILKKWLGQYSTNEYGPPPRGTPLRAGESLARLRVCDVLLMNPGNVRGFLSEDCIGCIPNVELTFPLRKPKPGAQWTPEEEYVRAFQEVLTKRPNATRYAFTSTNWRVYLNHYYEMDRYGGRPVGEMFKGLHIGWHRRWDEGRRLWVTDEALDKYVRLEYRNGMVLVKRDGPGGGEMVIVSDSATLRPIKV